MASCLKMPNLQKLLKIPVLSLLDHVPEHIRLMGNKVSAIIAMKKAGVPTVPGCAPCCYTIHNALAEAKEIGFPLIVKAASGGGGRGMRIVERVDTLLESVQAAQRDAEMWFGDDTVYMERFLQKPRHVEVQDSWVMVMVMRSIFLTVTVLYNVAIRKCTGRSTCSRLTGTGTR